MIISMEMVLMVKSILGDPGAVSGGGKKSKRARKKFGRRKVKPRLESTDFRTTQLCFQQFYLT